MKGRKRKREHKRKRKHAKPKYDREDEAEEAQPKRAMVENEEQTPVQPSQEELPGIPIPPIDHNNPKPKVIFILERASLEVTKVDKTHQLLNSDDHANFLRKNNKDPSHYRPDITHQALLSIIESPLNKAGRVRAVYIKTENNVLIEVKPYTRIPRAFKRFSCLMVQLLQKLRVSAVGMPEILLQVRENPVTQYLPINSPKIGFSRSSKKLVNVSDFLSTVPSDTDLVFVVGASAHGKIQTDYNDDCIAISGYPLSAAYCITRICGALEGKWNIF